MSEGHKRLLFVLREPSVVLRHFGGALDRLMETGTEVVIAYEGTNSLIGGFLDWCAERPLASPLALWARPEEKEERRRRRMLRLSQDYLRYFSPAFRKVEMLRKRAQHLAPPAILMAFPADRMLEQRQLAALQKVLAKGEAATPPLASDVNLLRAIDPDAVVVSPLIDFGSSQVDILKAAASEGIPTGLCVASWDNLTNKGLIRFPPNLVTVWNDAQKKEAVSFHGMAPDAVVTTGAQTFDSWFEQKPSRSRSEWLRSLGLPEDRRLVVYLCSSSQIGGNERVFVEKWLTALRASSEPLLANANVLVRPHPRNLKIWEPPEIAGQRNVAVWRYGEGPQDAAKTQADFYDTLYYADATVGLNTSSQIDASIVGAPVFSIIDKATNVGTTGTVHFRHLMAKNGGPTHVAKGIKKNLAQLAACLADPRKYKAINKQFVERFVRPHGLDRPGADLLAKALTELCEGRVNGLKVGNVLPPRPFLANLHRIRADRLIGYEPNTKPQAVVPLPKRSMPIRSLDFLSRLVGIERNLGLMLDPKLPIGSLILLHNLGRLMPLMPPKSLWLPKDAMEALGLKGLTSDAVRVRWLPRAAVSAGCALEAAKLPSREAVAEAEAKVKAEIDELSEEIKVLEAEMQQELAFVERFKLRGLEAGQRELSKMQRGLAIRRAAPSASVSRTGVRRVKKSLASPPLFSSDSSFSLPIEPGRKTVTIFAGAARDREVRSFIPFSRNSAISARNLIPMARAFERDGWQVLVFGARKSEWPKDSGSIHVFSQKALASGAGLKALSVSRFAVARGLFWTLYVRLFGVACLTLDAYDPWLHYPILSRDGALFSRLRDRDGQVVSLAALAERLLKGGRSGLEGLQVEPPAPEEACRAAQAFAEALPKNTYDDDGTSLRDKLWQAYNALLERPAGHVEHHVILGRGLVLEVDDFHGLEFDDVAAEQGDDKATAQRAISV